MQDFMASAQAAQPFPWSGLHIHNNVSPKLCSAYSVSACTLMPLDPLGDANAAAVSTPP